MLKQETQTAMSSLGIEKDIAQETMACYDVENDRPDGDMLNQMLMELLNSKIQSENWFQDAIS